MVIIISGCDRTGKTTFCNQLKTRLTDYEYIHFTAPKTKQEAYDRYLNFINQLNPEKLYILDRFYESEKVYAPIYRNYTIEYNHEFDQLLRNKTQVLFIYVRADLNIIKQRINDVGDDLINIKDIEQICYNYEQYMQNIQLPFITLNNNSFKDLQKNVDTSISIIKNYNLQGEYFGNIQAKKAIVYFNNVHNVHNYYFSTADDVQYEINIKKDTENPNNDYITYYDKKVKVLNFTEYFYTNNIDNIHILNIPDYLFVH